MDVYSLLKNTNAYKIFQADKARGTLSHAYLISCEDEGLLSSVLSIFAKALTCEESEPCGKCRTCKLVEAKTHTDVIYYPKSGSKIVVSDVDEIIEKSYYKPLELPVKAFVLVDVSKMTVQAQNKLLKTLEEPPENTFIIMGTTSVYPLLSTVLSRVKRLDIPAFSDGELKSFLLSNGYESDKINKVLPFANGRLSDALKKIELNESGEVLALAKNALVNLKSSKQVAEFSAKITKEILKDFITALAKLTQVAIKVSAGGNNAEVFSEMIEEIANSVSIGALLFISDKIQVAEKAVFFNGNHQAVVDGILFGILEGKFKWSK
jgi:DNA polymerase-3 subunit delta'